MKLLKSFLFGLALISAFAATDALADSTHKAFETRVAVTASVLDQHAKMEGGGQSSDWQHAPDVMAGINSTISFGYRWRYVGLYFDEELGGLWWTGDTKKIAKDGVFFGGSYVTVRPLIGIKKKIEIDFAVGVGMMYSAASKSSSSGDDNYEDYQDYSNDSSVSTKLIANKDGDSVPCFAIKVGVGFTYYVMKNFGLGVNFDYNLGIHVVSYDGGISHTTLFHHMNPGLHANIQF